MTESAVCTYLLSRLGRPVSMGVAEASANFFPEGVVEEDVSLLAAAADKIGTNLSAGAGEISRAELAGAVQAFYVAHGTPFCPPIVAALTA